MSDPISSITSPAPTVSVIIPLYNKAEFVERAIRSVLAQTVQDFEIVVVDDGSTDGGGEVACGILDPRIRFFSQTNAGVSAARNHGIDKARGAVVAFLDADDEWLPEFLETVLALRSDFPASRVWATTYLYRVPSRPDRSPILRKLPPSPWAGIIQDYFAIAAASDPPLWTSAVAVDLDALRKVDGFPLGITAGEDLLTWARLAINYPIAYSMRQLAIFYCPEKPQDRPGRVPDPLDHVGKSLKCLQKHCSGDILNNLRIYISLWYKMRALIYFQLSDGINARKEARKALLYSGKFRLKLYILMIISFIPNYGASYLFVFSKRLLQYFRKIMF